MKILIIGSGGRECALAWRLSQDESTEQVIVCPGNVAMAKLSPKIKTAPGKTLNDYLAVAKDYGVDFTFVGPEGPLVEGIKEYFHEQGQILLGPSRAAAQLEGSKIFSKEIMKKYSIPTARFKVAKSYEEACHMIDHWEFSENGFVIKADGLAGGKGVVVAPDVATAKEALHDFMVDEAVTVKSSEILLEEVLLGREASFFALCDGTNYQVLGMACDHKRLLDDDAGPNTGGMGCYRSLHWPTPAAQIRIENDILKKTLEGMKERGTPFQGILFIGVMIDENDHPHVVEYNVRFGDPETQTLLPLIEGNLSELFLSYAKGEESMNKNSVAIRDEASVHVVLVSPGYPSVGKHKVETGLLIEDQFKDKEGQHLFYAGVKEQDNHLVTGGGRVLGVTALGASIDSARSDAYEALKNVSFAGAHYRSDIGKGKI